MTDRIVATVSGLIQGKIIKLIDRGEHNGWHGFVLIAPGKRKAERRYHGAWNGERLSDVDDMSRLRQTHPELRRWLRMVCPMLWGQK